MPRPTRETALAVPVARVLVQQAQQLFGARLQSVILHGSYARGEASPESDVDLLAVIDREGGYDFDARGKWILAGNASRWEGRAVDTTLVVLPHPGEWGNLWSEMAFEAVLLYERDAQARECLANVREWVRCGILKRHEL